MRRRSTKIFIDRKGWAVQGPHRVMPAPTGGPWVPPGTPRPPRREQRPTAAVARQIIVDQLAAGGSDERIDYLLSAYISQHVIQVLPPVVVPRKSRRRDALEVAS